VRIDRKCQHTGNADQIFLGAAAPPGTILMTFQINGNPHEENNW
jgi:hypothetical protein